MATRTFSYTHGERYRIHPTGVQIPYFRQAFGCSRKVYNLRVAEGIKRDELARQWHEEDPDGRAGEAYPYEWMPLGEYKDEHPYLKDVDTYVTQSADEAYFQARKRHWNGAGSPRFKRRADYPRKFTTKSTHIKTGGTIYVHRDEGQAGRSKMGWLHIPKLPGRQPDRKRGVYGDDIPIVLHRPIAGEIHRATIVEEADGTWWAVLTIKETVEVEVEGKPTETDADALLPSMVGCDLGLKDYLVCSDGTVWDDPADYDSLDRRIRREERKLAKKRVRAEREGRKFWESKRYQRQRERVARLRRKRARKREDFRHKLSHGLVENHSLVVLEDLCVRGMLRNHHLARRVQDASFADFIRMVRYKAERAGKQVVLVDRFYPSTQTCSCCGAKAGPKGYAGLSVREWVCPECGCRHDRDENASWCLLLEGLRVLAESSSGEEAAYWSCCRETLVARHREECLGGPCDPPVDAGHRLDSAPAGGTPVAGRTPSSGSPVAAELGVYTGSPAVASGRRAGDAGEPGAPDKGTTTVRRRRATSPEKPSLQRARKRMQVAG